jgi:transcriptional regulator with XRE-family HTH domain
MYQSSEKLLEFEHFAMRLKLARAARKLKSHQLAERAGVDRTVLYKLEAGERKPTLAQLVRFARATCLPLQWFMTGGTAPGIELPDLAFELEALGVSDLSIADARIPGAFRPPEQIVAQVLSPLHVDPRLLDAIPAVLAWNRWKPRLLRAFCETTSPRAFRRAVWLADVVMTIHRGTRFPGGVISPRALDAIRGTVARELIAKKAVRGLEPDDLGFPGEPDALPPVSKRWNITYAADLDTFRDRAVQLIDHDRLGRFPERPDGRR